MEIHIIIAQVSDLFKREMQLDLYICCYYHFHSNLLQMYIEHSLQHSFHFILFLSLFLLIFTHFDILSYLLILLFPFLYLYFSIFLPFFSLWKCHTGTYRVEFRQKYCDNYCYDFKMKQFLLPTIVKLLVYMY